MVQPHGSRLGHGIRLMEEVGRLLGAWLKTSRAGAAARAAPALNSPEREKPGP